MATALKTPDIEAALAALDATLLTDEAERRYHSQDTAEAGELPLAVFRPHSVAALAEGVRLATASGLAVFPRGGGMSYTSGYLPDRTSAVLIDLAGLTAITEINPQDLHVTVEAGCTWAALDAALAPHGLRTPFWGPFSGYTATVGGSMSQGTATFGTARNGLSGENVIGFDIVTACGDILTTGPAGQATHSQFMRQYGPDLTGLFTNDCGALGIKARITLPLEPRPEEVAGLSFLFEDFAALAAAMQAIDRAGLASEAFAMDPAVTRQFSGQNSGFTQDLQQLLAIGRAQGSWAKGLLRMAEVARAGRRFLGREGYHLHVVTEADDAPTLRRQQARIRKLAATGSVELPSTVPTMVRATPFSPLPVLSPTGGRVYPLHGIVPWSKAKPLDDAMQALITAHAPASKACNLTIGTSFFGVARSGLLYEPVLYWPDARLESHERRTTTDLPRHPANPEATALVKQITAEMLALYRQHSATHLQIGRMYPWAEDRNPPAMALIRAIKAELDPHNLINPGVLGL
ncbi:MAG: FAD-binding oxidoreductase [Polymorphobacter sp.]|uniref:FAD-binding oxidoreductase n=1 Tax=Polymorphobacter sp. TaxID=1909290 RepID=UPI003A899040